MARGAVGYTTRQAIATEQRMLALEATGRTLFTSLHDDDQARAVVAKAEVAANRRGHKWNDGQRAATRGLLLSTTSVTGIQGSAGTAKTTTVLSVYADAARAQGLTVRALAPTSNAAKELGRAIRAEPMTVARLLIDDGSDIAQGREVWIVDEASMLSARDAEQVLERARDAQARLVLVGDVRQLGSVAAGRAFGQLQDSGMNTHKLAEIVRQTNDHTREAVEALLKGDAATAFAALDDGGGEVVEHADDDVRHARIARDFARLSPAERARTLVLDPTRVGRQQLTDAIRAELRRDGTLGNRAMVATVLESCGLTDAQRTHAASYRLGTIVLFRSNDDEYGLRRDTAYRVDGIDPSANTLRLLDPANQAIAWDPAQGGADHAEAYAEVAQEFRTGDRIQFTRNNHSAKRVNGRTAEVVAIDPDEGLLVVRNKTGKRQTLDMARVADRHIRPGWVQTIHAAQGATSDRVMAHLESFRSNVDARIAYVAVSRAKTHAAIYTDDRLALVDAIEGRDGAKVGAIDETLARGKVAAIAIPAPVRVVGMTIGG